LVTWKSTASVREISDGLLEMVAMVAISPYSCGTRSLLGMLNRRRRTELVRAQQSRPLSEVLVVKQEA
jgi:hypothetical protein